MRRQGNGGKLALEVPQEKLLVIERRLACLDSFTIRGRQLAFEREFVHQLAHDVVGVGRAAAVAACEHLAAVLEAGDEQVERPYNIAFERLKRRIGSEAFVKILLCG